MRIYKIIFASIVLLLFIGYSTYCLAQYNPDEHTLFLAHYDSSINADNSHGDGLARIADGFAKGMMRLTARNGGIEIVAFPAGGRSDCDCSN